MLGSLEDWHAPLDPKDYYDILAPHTCRVDIWETEYVQIMDSAAAIAEDCTDFHGFKKAPKIYPCESG